jgi:hypothetical protein
MLEALVAREEITLLTELNKVIERAQRVLARHLPPESSITEREAINMLIEVLDSPALSRVQVKVAALLEKQPALFSDLDPH